jgi:hypothetical protein
MDEEQKQNAILERLKEMGVQVDQPLFSLSWKDVARVMVETDGFDNAADFPTDILVHTLNTVQDGLEYLDWYGNIQSSLRLMNLSLQIEDEHLEAEQEDRITRTDE